MAGAGYKLFNTGDVLTAAQVNTYLQEQTVMVFANSTARTTALSGVLAEGMMSYLQDTNSVEVYNGTSWVNVGNAGDITEVQAGVGISIASGTGPIPVITNSSTDLITTAGDLLYGTAADTVARLGIGTAGQVLTVNSGATAPEWATAAGGGGMTLISTTTINNDATITLSSIPGTYNHLQVIVRDYRPATDTAALQCRINGDSNTRYITSSTTSNTNATFGNSALSITLDSDNGASDSLVIFDLFDYANATTYKLSKVFSVVNNPSTTTNGAYQERYGIYNQTGAITSLVFLAETGNMTSGTILLYGVK